MPHFKCKTGHCDPDNLSFPYPSNFTTRELDVTEHMIINSQHLDKR